MKVFAERLKELRVEKKLTMTELADKLHCSVMAVSRWERGKQTPNIETLIVIAKFFNVSTDYLCGLED